ERLAKGLAQPFTAFEQRRRHRRRRKAVRRDEPGHLDFAFVHGAPLRLPGDVLAQMFKPSLCGCTLYKVRAIPDATLGIAGQHARRCIEERGLGRRDHARSVHRTRPRRRQRHTRRSDAATGRSRDRRDSAHGRARRSASRPCHGLVQNDCRVREPHHRLRRRRRDRAGPALRARALRPSARDACRSLPATAPGRRARHPARAGVHGCRRHHSHRRDRAYAGQRARARVDRRRADVPEHVARSRARRPMAVASPPRAGRRYRNVPL
ncbi:MAG: hypothetical protein AVDCRST_MAG71-351, partial [uncultured Lysobacter sp.]